MIAWKTLEIAKRHCQEDETIIEVEMFGHLDKHSSMIGANHIKILKVLEKD